MLEPCLLHPYFHVAGMRSRRCSISRRQPLPSWRPPRRRTMITTITTIIIIISMIIMTTTTTTIRCCYYYYCYYYYCPDHSPAERCSVEPNRGVSKPTVYMFLNCSSVVIYKLQTTVPNRTAHFYILDEGQLWTMINRRVTNPPFPRPQIALSSGGLAWRSRNVCSHGPRRGC